MGMDKAIEIVEAEIVDAESRALAAHAAAEAEVIKVTALRTTLVAMRNAQVNHEEKI